MERSGAHLDRDPVDPAEHLIVMEDLLHPLLGITDDERPFPIAESIEMGTLDRGPAPFLPELTEHPLVAGEVIITSFLRRTREGTKGMDADLELLGRMARHSAGLTVEIDQRTETIQAGPR